VQQAHAPGDMVALAVEARHIQRVVGKIDGVEIGQARLRDSQRDGDRTGASADIGHERRLSSVQASAYDLERGIDQQFRLWSGNQHAAVYEEVQAIKLLVAGEIGHRLASRAPLDQLLELLRLRLRQRTFGIGQERDALRVKHTRQQDLGIQARRRQADFRQSRRRSPQCFLNRGHVFFTHP